MKPVIVNLTLDMAKQAVQIATDLMGDEYVCPEGFCVYVADGKPSCLVGRALHHMGVPLEFMTQRSEFELAVDLLRELVELNVIGGVEWEAQVFLVAVQRRQDAGMSWGEVRDGALWTVSRYRGKPSWYWG